MAPTCRGRALKTPNWIFAYFDEKSLVEFGLPAGIHPRVQNKNLSGMNLGAIYLLDSDLRGFDFHKADLNEARFLNVDLHNVNFSQADLTKAKLHSVSGAIKLSGADLQQASIKYSSLARANLQRSYMQTTAGSGHRR